MGRIAASKGVGRTRKFDGKKFECISVDDRKVYLQRRGKKGKENGNWKQARVTDSGVSRGDAMKYMLWVRY